MRDQILKAAIKYLADMGMKKLQIFKNDIYEILNLIYIVLFFQYFIVKWAQKKYYTK